MSLTSLSNFPYGISALPTPSGTSPVFSFHTVPDMIACATGSIAWDYSGGSALSSPFPLVVTNIGVSQSPEVTTQAVRRVGRQTVGLRQVNETLNGQMDPLVGTFSWNPVKVPQGWYTLVAYGSQFSAASSNDFLVINGSDTSCLIVTSPSGGPSTSRSFLTSITSSSSSSDVPVLVASPHNAGSIAGGVIGGLTFILMIVAMLFYWRRRSSKNWAVQPVGGQKEPPRSITQPRHSNSESMGPMLTPVKSVDHPETHMKDMASPPSSEEDISMSREKGFVYYDGLVKKTPFPNRNRTASTVSSLRSHRQRSMSGNAIYGSSESDVPLNQRSNSNMGRRSVDNTPFFQIQRQSDISLAMSPFTIEPRSIRESDRSSSGRRASRKPVPIYDASEFETSTVTSSSNVTMDRQNLHPMTSQSSLVTEHGDKPIHYLIPDIPPPVKHQR